MYEDMYGSNLLSHKRTSEVKLQAVGNYPTWEPKINFGPLLEHGFLHNELSLQSQNAKRI